MPQYRLSPPVHKSNWRNIWEGIKNAWRAAGVFGKLTFVFRLAWSLLVLGFMRKMITVIFVALAVAAVAVVLAGLVIWGMLEGGYKFFLHPITMFLAIPWMVVGVSYLYLRKKYPGKYANVSGYTTEAKYMRSIPIVGGIVLSAFFVAYQLMKPFLWWILVGAAAIVGMVVIYYVVKSLTTGSSEETTKKAKEVLVLALSLTVALGVINWLLWVLDAELWGSVWATPSRFWAINLGILLAILLLFVAKGADGKPHPVAKIFSQIIGGLVAMILIVCLWDFMTDKQGWAYWGGKTVNFGSHNREDSMVASRYDGIPAEVALPQICGCESSGVAGRVWHYKKGDLNQGLTISETNDIGACQINAPLHEKTANDEYKIDIRTPDGNMAYAKILYQKHGVQPWIGKPGKTTIGCWGPKLAELRGAKKYEVKLVAPAGDFGPARDVAGYEFFWGRSPGAFVVRNDQGLEAKFDPQKNIRENLPYLEKGDKKGFSRTIQFKSLSDKPQEVVLELTRQ